ncbi:hypothetical protein [Butyrivibrio sp. INlla14]|uniref:hypothetical protein n=1 Tax=Butyrivibrio sp. INlla14 TaxID=1520808 RepID=UPI00087717A1|nr:hypothetical protein [Butyrivibrio sp. INlla14]SCY67895.1 hypothetical protein SAMN02910371_03352 [Butyrivibrio sp. INlla14]
MYTNNQAGTWDILLYIFIILMGILIRLYAAWAISNRAYMIVSFKGYSADEVRIGRLAVVTALFFGIIASFIAALVFVHALPDRGEID